MKERLILFLKYLGIGQDKFSASVGLSKGFVNNIGDSIRKRSLDKITAVYPDLNINWLMTGEGEMLLSSMKSKEENEESLQNYMNKITDSMELLARSTYNFSESNKNLSETNKKLVDKLEKFIPDSHPFQTVTYPTREDSTRQKASDHKGDYK